MEYVDLVICNVMYEHLLIDIIILIMSAVIFEIEMKSERIIIGNVDEWIEETLYLVRIVNTMDDHLRIVHLSVKIFIKMIILWINKVLNQIQKSL